MAAILANPEGSKYEYYLMVEFRLILGNRMLISPSVTNFSPPAAHALLEANLALIPAHAFLRRKSLKSKGESRATTIDAHCQTLLGSRMELRRSTRHYQLFSGARGIHMITQQAEANRSGVLDPSDTVDLTIIMEHHQRGLEGFRKEVSCITSSNVELAFTGSLLLVGFAFASLRVQELNPPDMIPEEMNRATIHSSPTNGILRLNWLYLNRGVSTVIQDQWDVLKASRLRQMVIYPHGDGYLKDLPFDASSSRLSRCSPRLFKFAEGASEAVANMKASISGLEPAKDDLSSHSSVRTSQPSPSTSLGLVVDECSGAIEILETVYSRILYVLQCAATETSVDKEIQLDFEEAAILSWPILLPSTFLASVQGTEHDYFHGHSLVVLAHFYLVNTLVDSWFLRGSFEREILKINDLIGTQTESQLSKLMLWPIEVMNLPSTSTP
ncbi:uncharacterized protein N7477_006975 [Penicillium maclennaniae]|uniref:uncharacterized protein n=1 Tax=Penicillium maclennaniae TaxID=1343394 RepID=UPI0025414DEE|nr:uncharacterized protein N7477_006975 [Penicillium maclennaniae]KAJ5668405.1 hypothetical protein N7477_006975 [Penicillium maclennaniae]